MRDELMEMIANIAEVSLDQVKPESSLINDLEMDSLMLLDLTVTLQNILNQEIKPEELVALKTVNDVFDFVKERKK